MMDILEGFTYLATLLAIIFILILIVSDYKHRIYILKQKYDILKNMYECEELEKYKEKEKEYRELKDYKILNELKQNRRKKKTKKLSD